MLKSKDVVYLCDKQACMRVNRSCMTDALCKYTTNPEHAVNGYCEHPEREPDRFDEVTIYDGDNSIICYQEREDFDKGRRRGDDGTSDRR